jgi:hypothetical protein
MPTRESTVQSSLIEVTSNNFRAREADSESTRKPSINEIIPGLENSDENNSLTNASHPVLDTRPPH